MHEPSRHWGRRPVDEQGIDVDQLIATGAEGALITPSHQFPIGGVLSAGRRQRLVRWLEQHDGYVLEDDYDAEFRYDQASVGALQGLAADRVMYAGTASKTLAPALRIGWLVVPPELVRPMDAELRRWKEGSPRIEQDAWPISSKRARTTGICGKCGESTVTVGSTFSIALRQSSRNLKSKARQQVFT